MKRSAWTATIATLVLLVGIGFIYIYSGSYNIAATDPHTSLGNWLFSTVKVQSIQRHAEPASWTADSAMVQAGSRRFKEMCVICHGAPGVEAAWIGKGLRPNPPKLSKAVKKYSQGELTWIVRHGIKMAGMPALDPTHSEEAIRSVVAFIQQLPEMSPQEYQMMTKTDTAQAGSVHRQGGHVHSH